MGATWCTRLAKAEGAAFGCGFQSWSARLKIRSLSSKGNQKLMKTKILVVEDDPHIQLGLKEVLSSDGFDVFTCNRGDQAVEALARHRPALLVLDVMLPGLSG